MRSRVFFTFMPPFFNPRPTVRIDLVHGEDFAKHRLNTRYLLQIDRLKNRPRHFYDTHACTFFHRRAKSVLRVMREMRFAHDAQRLT